MKIWENFIKSLLSLRLYRVLKNTIDLKMVCFRCSVSLIIKTWKFTYSFYFNVVDTWSGKGTYLATSCFLCLVFYLFFFMLLTVDVAMEEEWYQERLYWPAPSKMARLTHLVLGCHLKWLILLMSISMVSWKDSLFLGIFTCRFFFWCEQMDLLGIYSFVLSLWKHRALPSTLVSLSLQVSSEKSKNDSFQHDAVGNPCMTLRNTQIFSFKF